MKHVFIGGSSGTQEIDSIRNVEKGETLWVDLTDPSREDIEPFLSILSIHQIDVDRFFEKDRGRSRLIVHHNYISCTVYFIEGDLCDWKKTKIDLFFGSNFLVTLHNESIKQLDQIAHLLSSEKLLEHGHPDLVLYHLLNQMLIPYMALTEDILKEVTKLNNQLDAKKNHYNKIRQIRQHAVKLAAVTGNEERIMKLIGDQYFPYTSEKNKAYFAALADQMAEVVDNMVEIRDSLNETIEAYTSLQSNNMNKVMKTLTVLSTIFLPGTLIASIYGMNFHIPEYHWRFGYGYALTLIILVSVGLYIYIHRRKWI